jgi:hypothetical protein
MTRGHAEIIDPARFIHRTADSGMGECCVLARDAMAAVLSQFGWLGFGLAAAHRADSGSRQK